MRAGKPFSNYLFLSIVSTYFPSVAEPPLFWPAPEVRGPGVDSGCGQIGSAPAPCKKAAPAPYTNSFHFELLKSELLMKVFFGSHLPL